MLFYNTVQFCLTVETMAEFFFFLLFPIYSIKLDSFSWLPRPIRVFKLRLALSRSLLCQTLAFLHLKVLIYRGIMTD